ncbi:MAG: hypothetical protein Q8N99_03835 [Nanoarchaeota archaeon]|nr:hypothetical protein [Nanoarchaeota archaeon]
MEEHNFKIISIIFIIIGLLLIGVGITGNAIRNTSPDQCKADSECSSEKICCFYNSIDGMCGDPQTCEKISNYGLEIENPKKQDDYYFYFYLGLGIVIISGLFLYSMHLKDKIISRINNRIVKKKKRR